jgi:lambda family phage tail tape measure protein
MIDKLKIEVDSGEAHRVLRNLHSEIKRLEKKGVRFKLGTAASKTILSKVNKLYKDIETIEKKYGIKSATVVTQNENKKLNIKKTINKQTEKNTQNTQKKQTKIIKTNQQKQTQIIKDNVKKQNKILSSARKRQAQINRIFRTPVSERVTDLRKKVIGPIQSQAKEISGLKNRISQQKALEKEWANHKQAIVDKDTNSLRKGLQKRLALSRAADLKEIKRAATTSKKIKKIKGNTADLFWTTQPGDGGKSQGEEIIRRKAERDKGDTRRGGLSSIGRSRGITQMPQNPLLGRMAQFGMMASGMAATLFLMQMITAQISNLMEIIKSWNEALLGVIDKTTMVGSDMKSLSESIRSYSRATGISRANIAGAVTAASSYGISPSQANITQLHGLSQSGAVGSPEAAAKLMAGAGTEFGDNMIKQAIKKWDIYSGKGKGKETGTFGFEWDKLKGAGVELMLQSWDKYSKGFLLTMRAISDYVVTNRFKIVEMFDNFIEKLKSLWKMLKTIAPALAAFMALWVVNTVKTTIVQSITAIVNLMPAFITGINTVGTATAVAAAKMTTAEKAIEATRMSVIRLKAAVFTLGAGLIAVAATWAILKLNDKAKEMNKMNDAYTKFHHTNEKMMKTWSRAKMDQSMFDLGGAIGAMETTMPTLNKPQAAMMKLKLDHLKEVYALMTKINDAQKLEIESGAALATKTVMTQADQLTLLQEINKELGYMPAKYFKIQETVRQQTLTKGKANFPELTGEIGTLNAKKAFQALMLENKDLESMFKDIEHSVSLAQGGMNQFEKQAFLVTSVLGYLIKTGKDTDEVVIALEKSLDALNKAAKSERLRQYTTALDALKTTVSQLDMTDFEKQIANMRKKHQGVKPELELQAKIILGDKFKKQLAALQHKNLDLAGQQRDIQASNMPEADKKIMTEHLTLQDNIAKLEVKLNREKDKGLKISSIEQINLENRIKNTKLLIRANLNNISQKELAAQTEKNDALNLLNLNIRLAKKKQEAGKLESEALGYTSATERAANLRLKELNTVKILLNSLEGMTDADRNRLAANAKTTRELKDQISAANELVNLYSGLDRLEGRGMSSQTEQARLVLIQKNANKLSSEGRDPSEYIRSSHFQLEQDKLKEQTLIWNEYYSITDNMTREAYSNRLRIIQDHYAQNIIASNETYAELIRQEEMHQLNLKNRRNLSLSEDLHTGAIEATKKLGKQYKTLGQIMESSIGKATDGISGALHSMVMGTKSAKEAFRQMAISILNDITKMIIKQLVLNAVMGIVRAFGGGMGAGGASVGMVGGGEAFANFAAKGAAMTGISAYSNQIVSQPTFVPSASKITQYATGGAVFGEGGPEGILPLTRMPSGNLGVETSSKSGGDVNIINHISIESGDTGDEAENNLLAENISNMIEVKVKQVIGTEKRYGGLLY